MGEAFHPKRLGLTSGTSLDATGGHGRGLYLDRDHDAWVLVYE